MGNLTNIFIGLHLMAICMGESALHKKKIIELIPNEVRDELNRRVGVKGAMGGNITMTSNSSLGSGTITFVFPGRLDNGEPVALKLMNDSSVYFDREYRCYELLEATSNIECVKYGIPFIYSTEKFLDFKMMAVTMLDTDLMSIHKKIGSFSKETILILFKDLIRSLKYIHSNGVINEDIKPENIMTKAANVFFCDFNQCDLKTLHNPPNRGNPYFMSIAVHMRESPAEYDDLPSLFYTMLVLADVRGANHSWFSPADVELPWSNLTDRREMMEYKQRISGEDLCKRVNHPELIEPYERFYTEVMESAQLKRLPKYDYLYRIFDDVLYNGRNRSERIVFEWLTSEQREAAMEENVPTIESIVFRETTHLS